MSDLPTSVMYTGSMVGATGQKGYRVLRILFPF